MLQSMTGFGRASAAVGPLLVEVEIRAVNARSSQVQLRLPPAYRDEEARLRKRVQAVAPRGKVDVTVERKESGGAAVGVGVDGALLRRLQRQLEEIAPGTSAAPAVVASLLRLPGVVGATEEALREGETERLGACVDAALADLVAFRREEGRSLAADLAGHVATVRAAIDEVEAFEPARQRRMRERLERLVAEKLQGTAVDRARLEQEVLFYLERVDVSEEKARLAQHCDFFLEKLRGGEDGESKGRRLTFIAQEMGREINTLGAKAYSSDIQRVVVDMKDALEKIKEQLANVA